MHDMERVQPPVHSQHPLSMDQHASIFIGLSKAITYLTAQVFFSINPLRALLARLLPALPTALCLPLPAKALTVSFFCYGS